MYRSSEVINICGHVCVLEVAKGRGDQGRMFRSPPASHFECKKKRSRCRACFRVVSLGFGVNEHLVTNTHTHTHTHTYSTSVSPPCLPLLLIASVCRFIAFCVFTQLPNQQHDFEDPGLTTNFLAGKKFTPPNIQPSINKRNSMMIPSLFCIKTTIYICFPPI